MLLAVDQAAGRGPPSKAAVPDGTQAITVSRNYSLPTIKTLFALATHCAYPGCSEPLIFEDRQRGVRAVGVQIAHVRSETPDGPRYDRCFPRSKLNEPENLLLLCGKHHTAVDQHESVFTTEELLERASLAPG